MAALLAAGAGTRFRGTSHKLLAPLRGRTVIDASLDAVVAAGFTHIIVVTGAVELPHTIVDRPGVTVRHNPRWADGQATS
ncbi:MAG: NTP transferase domain-containing protein, partial [Ilumatobacteraceae bacterium]